MRILDIKCIFEKQKRKAFFTQNIKPKKFCCSLFFVQTIRDKVEIWDRNQKLWFRGIIKKISFDKEGEWLKVKYLKLKSFFFFCLLFRYISGNFDIWPNFDMSLNEVRRANFKYF